MADKEKKVAQNSKVDKATTEESKAAEKVAKAAKGSKNNKPNFFARAGKGIKRFGKDFKGETKKIVWPDATTVLKNTGIVLVVVTIVTAIVFAIDFGLENGIVALKEAAIEKNQSTTAPVEGDESKKTASDAPEADDETESTEETSDVSEETTEEANTDAEGDESAENGEAAGTQEDETTEESVNE